MDLQRFDKEISNKVSQLITAYSSLCFNPEQKNLYKIDGPIVYYLEPVNSNVQVQVLDTWYLDIVSAFPTLCNWLYSHKPEFLRKLNGIQDKKSRNIFISTTLKSHELKLLNILSKLIICGAVVTLLRENVFIFELKKDGVLFCCLEKDDDYILQELFIGKDFFSVVNSLRLTTSEQNFIELLREIGIKFHIEFWNFYIRANKTSYYININESRFEVKGRYKKMPKFFEELFNRFMSGEVEKEDISALDVYDEDKFDLIKSAALQEYINFYYKCGENLILTKDGKYKVLSQTALNEIDPTLYLKIFTRPLAVFVNPLS